LSLLFLLQPAPHPTHLHSFPTRRSSDLHPCGENYDRIARVGDRTHHRRTRVRVFFHLHVHPKSGFPISYEKWTKWLHLIERRYRSEEHTSELQSRENLVCRLLLEKKNTN